MNQQTVTYDVAACSIYPLLTDTIGGGSPTYGQGTQLTGIANVTFNPDVITAQLKGDDGKVIASHGRVDMMSFSLTYGRLNMAALAIMLGGAVVDAGTGANEMVSYTLPGFNTLPFFRCEVQITDLDNGINDCHLIGWKCQLKTATFVDDKTDAFGQPTIDCNCITTLGAFAPYQAPSAVPQMASVVFYATQTALSATN